MSTKAQIADILNEDYDMAEIGQRGAEAIQKIRDEYPLSYGAKALAKYVATIDKTAERPTSPAWKKYMLSSAMALAKNNYEWLQELQNDTVGDNSMNSSTSAMIVRMYIHPAHWSNFGRHALNYIDAKKTFFDRMAQFNK